jgi:3-oxoacyl-[acyl-carrier-protein] synthase-1
MRRVVVTGMGIVSCIGTDQQTVLQSLQEGRSGIVFRPEYEARGMRSHVAGAVDMDFSTLIDRKDLRFMAAAAAYAPVLFWALVALLPKTKSKLPTSCAKKG